MKDSVSHGQRAQALFQYRQWPQSAIHATPPVTTTWPLVSEAVLKLKPVTFHYKSDSTVTPQFGLIAEEVAKVNPALVVRDEKGEIYTVRYDAVNAMLLNEFLKEHSKVEKQQTTLAQQQSTIAELKSAVTKQQATIAQQQKQIEALAAGLQKVSAAVELNKAAPTQVADTR